MAKTTRLASPTSIPVGHCIRIAWCYFRHKLGGKKHTVRHKNLIPQFVRINKPSNLQNIFTWPKKTKEKSTVYKGHISSDDEENLQKSDEDLEFLDEGVVEKVKKKTSRLCRVDGQTPCWKFFKIMKGDESIAECNKCNALITCVNKHGKLTMTALNTHFQS